MDHFLNTPTIRAVWNIPDSDKMEVITRDSQKLLRNSFLFPENSKKIDSTFKITKWDECRIIPRCEISVAKIGNGHSHHPNYIF